MGIPCGMRMKALTGKNIFFIFFNFFCWGGGGGELCIIIPAGQSNWEVLWFGC